VGGGAGGGSAEGAARLGAPVPEVKERDRESKRERERIRVGEEEVGERTATNEVARITIFWGKKDGIGDDGR
jgi:hypothetical protein